MANKHKIANLEIKEDKTSVDLKGIAPNTILVISSNAAGNMKMLALPPDAILNEAMEAMIAGTTGLCWRQLPNGQWGWVPC